MHNLNLYKQYLSNQYKEGTSRKGLQTKQTQQTQQQSSADILDSMPIFNGLTQEDARPLGESVVVAPRRRISINTIPTASTVVNNNTGGSTFPVLTSFPTNSLQYETPTYTIPEQQDTYYNDIINAPLVQLPDSYDLYMTPEEAEMRRRADEQFYKYQQAYNNINPQNILNTNSLGGQLYDGITKTYNPYNKIYDARGYQQLPPVRY